MAEKPTYEELQQRIQDLEARAARAHADAELYSKLLATMPDIVVRLDLDGTVREINRAGLKGTGYEPSELVGQNMLFFIAPEDHERVMLNSALMFQAKLGPQEYQLLLKDGSKVPYEVNGDLLRDRQGNPVGMVQTCRNIAERARAREALRESEQRYRSVVENSHNGISIIDDAAKIVYVNDEYCRMTGYPRDEVMGRDFKFILAPESLQLVANHYEMRQKGLNPPSRYEFRVIRKDGETRWVETSSTVTEDSNGKKNTVAQLLDITERKTARWEKERLEAQLRHAQKMEAVGVLAGGVAHDFNNILQVISGQVQIMSALAGCPPEYTHRLDEVDRAIARASELVQRLLTFSRKVEPRFSLVDVNHELTEAVKMLEMIIPKMISVEISLAPDVKAIEADPNQLNQMLLNLGTNASDAMPQGGRLAISTARVRLDEAFCSSHLGAKPGDYIRISVADSGVGMDPETLEHVFDPFFTTKDLGRGTGLGLAMTYGIVNSHEGFITCDSRPGQGTTFEVYLPARAGKSPKTPASTPRPTQALNGDEFILVVDDEPSIINITREVLARHGYRTAAASSGEQALDYYARHQAEVDMLILDLGMPGMGGRECLERLLALNPGLKVIIASGYSDQAHNQDLAQAGAAGLLRKPYRLGDLLGKVRQVLEGRHASE